MNKKVYGFVLVLMLVVGLVCAPDDPSEQVWEDTEWTTINFEESPHTAVVTNADVKTEGDNTIVNIKSGGTIEIKGLEYNIDVSKKNEFVFDKGGDLIEGTMFSVPKGGGNYRLKGFDVPLPEKTEVIYEEDKIVLKIPRGGKIEESKAVEGYDGEEGILSYQSDEGIKLSREDIQGRDGRIKEINYDKNGFYVSEDITVKTSDGKDDFLVNVQGEKTYLVFDEDKINKDLNSVFIGADKVILINLNGKGASVFFTENNRLGMKITLENTVSVQAVKGMVIVGKAGEDNLGKLANVQISGESIANLDKRVFYAGGEELYFNPEGSLIEGFEHGENDAAVKLSLIDNEGKGLKGFDVYSNGKDQYASAAESQFESQLEFYKTEGDFYVSSTVTFNQLTPEAQRFYASLTPEAQKEILDFVQEKGGTKDSASFQGALNELIASEIKRKRNPYFASAKLSSQGTGGSATIIGIDKEGHPIAVTAGHVVRTPGRSVTLTLDTDNGKITYTGKVVGGTHVPDIAVIKIDQVDFNAPYVPVASSENIKVGDVAIRMGYPSENGRVLEAVNAQVIRIGGNQHEISASEVDGPMPGSSGGGLFVNGELAGTTSQTPGWGSGEGYYTGPRETRALLNQLGYGYILKISLLIFRDWIFVDIVLYG